MSEKPDIHVLYDWVCRMEEELGELKSAFPEVLAADRNRLIASIRCARVSLEVRVRARFPKRPRRSIRAARPPQMDPGQTRK